MLNTPPQYTAREGVLDDAGPRKDDNTMRELLSLPCFDQMDLLSLHQYQKAYPLSDEYSQGVFDGITSALALYQETGVSLSTAQEVWQFVGEELLPQVCHENSTPLVFTIGFLVGYIHASFVQPIEGEETRSEGGQA